MHLLDERFIFWGWWSWFSERESHSLSNGTNVASWHANLLFVFTSWVNAQGTLFSSYSLSRFFPWIWQSMLLSNFYCSRFAELSSWLLGSSRAPETRGGEVHPLKQVLLARCAQNTDVALALETMRLFEVKIPPLTLYTSPFSWYSSSSTFSEEQFVRICASSKVVESCVFCG